MTDALLDSALATGEKLHALARQLFPLHRSITGEGVRQTFEILSRIIPIVKIEIPTGTTVFDWTIPREWKCPNAYIADENGEKIVDLADSNLHVVNYSLPVRAKMQWSELQPHIHTISEHRDRIPYRTAFFRDTWGFCVNGSQYDRLVHGGDFEVVIDAEFFDGSLTVGSLLIRGDSDETVLIHCHTCHPSLANDNLSGIVIATFLAATLLKTKTRLTYQFVFAPATIGPIAWLSLQSPQSLAKIKHGLVLSLLGDGGGFTFKETRAGDSILDRLVPNVLAAEKVPYVTKPFDPFGYDERQYSSPGINLPVARLSRSDFASFDEYHTSADNLEFITPLSLGQSFSVCKRILFCLEGNLYPVSLKPYCEPRLGECGIFRAYGESDDRGVFQKAVMWVLSLADGTNDLLTISERSGLTMCVIQDACHRLFKEDLLRWSTQSSSSAFEVLAHGKKIGSDDLSLKTAQTI